MSKILAVFGATGQQGGGLIDFVLKDPELSQKFTIRAITRDVASDKAKQLKEKVQVVAGDAQDRASLETALTGVHTVFAMTAPAFEPNGLEIEYNGAKNIADVAVEKGVDYIVFSTLPSVREVSGGKYTKVIHFDSKAKAEKYIRGLPIKSAFYSPGFFMENFKGMHLFAPQKAPDGSWVLPAQLSSRDAGAHDRRYGGHGQIRWRHPRGAGQVQGQDVQRQCGRIHLGGNSRRAVQVHWPKDHL